MDSGEPVRMPFDNPANKARVIADGERLPGEGIYLRLVEPGDCGEAYLSWLNDPEVSRFLETRWREQTDASLRDFVHAVHQRAGDYLFAIVRTNYDRHVGNIKLGAISHVHRYADVGYFIGERDVWGTGIATEAIRIVTRFAFVRVGLHRVQAVVNVGNKASARALERAGFAAEGLARKSCGLARDGATRRPMASCDIHPTTSRAEDSLYSADVEQELKLAVSPDRC